MSIKRAAALLCAAGLALSSAFTAFAEPAESETDTSSVTEAVTETAPTETTPTETTTETTTDNTTTETAKPRETTATTQTTTAEKTDTVTTTVKEPDSSEEDTETTTETEPVSEDETTTTTTAKPSDEPTFVALSAGDIVNDSFTLSLDISPERKISSAVISIKYDEKLFELDDFEINIDIGGMPAGNSDPGLFTFSYINTAGTDYSGTYLTLDMDVIDTQMTSSVIYVIVETLEDTDLQEIPNNISNAVINYREESLDDIDRPSRADDSGAEGSTFRVKLGDLPLTLEELGIKDVKNVMNVRSLDSSVASYSQGAVSFVGVGETEIIVRMNDDSEQRITIIVSEADEEIQSGTEDVQSNKTLRNIAIAITVIGGAIIIFIEYIVICKPFGKKKKKPSAVRQEQEESSVVEYDEDDVEMVQDPEEVFKRKPKPKPQPKQAKPQQQAKPKQKPSKKPQPQAEPKQSRSSGRSNKPKK